MILMIFVQLLPFPSLPPVPNYVSRRAGPATLVAVEPLAWKLVVLNGRHFRRRCLDGQLGQLRVGELRAHVVGVQLRLLLGRGPSRQLLLLILCRPPALLPPPVEEERGRDERARARYRSYRCPRDGSWTCRIPFRRGRCYGR